MMSWNSLGFQEPCSFSMQSIFSINDYIMLIVLSILLSILYCMVWTVICTKFYTFFNYMNEIEVSWTILPAIFLMSICVPSIDSLFLMDTCNFCGLNLKTMGHQWYWSYYINEKNFDSYMANDSFLRCLLTDNSLVVPTMTPIRMFISSADVIHSWSLPSAGVKMDAVPGRINQLCFTLKKSGVFYGQCSEICGANHSFMPICLESIPMSVMNKMF